MQIKFKFKEFEIFLWKNERPGLESQRSRKRLYVHRKISNSLNLLGFLKKGLEMMYR